MNINLSISAAPGITNYLIVAAYEASNPTVVVQYIVLPKPLVADENITFIDLQPVVHYVRIWENATNVPGGSLRHEFIYDPEYADGTLQVRDDLFLVVGAGAGNPVAGNTSFTLASLTDWDYTIERRGFGSMKPNVDVQFSLNHDTFTLILSDGGIDDVFQEGEVFILHFVPKIQPRSPIESTTSGRVFSSTVVLTTNTTLTASDVGKSFLIQSVNDKITINLPALNTMPENRMMCFISDGGMHLFATLQVNGTDKIQWLNSERQTIILGQSERVWVYYADGDWQVAASDGHFSDVGEFFMTHDNTILNAVMADGSILDRAVYPRLWQWIQGLDASCIVTEANWLNPALHNEGRYSSGDGSTTFRIPKLFDQGFVRPIDGTTRTPGSYQNEEVGTHNHPTNRTRTDIVGTQYEENRIRGGSDRGLYVGDDITTGNNAGSENRPKNTGVYFMIRC